MYLMMSRYQTPSGVRPIVLYVRTQNTIGQYCNNNKWRSSSLEVCQNLTTLRNYSQYSVWISSCKRIKQCMHLKICQHENICNKHKLNLMHHDNEREPEKMKRMHIFRLEIMCHWPRFANIPPYATSRCVFSELEKWKWIPCMYMEATGKFILAKWNTGVHVQAV